MTTVTKQSIARRMIELQQNNDDYEYNCWAFTADVFGWIDHLRWLDDREMDRFLNKYCYPISASEARAGDVMVFRAQHDVYRHGYKYHDKGELLHTAIYLGNKRLAHKPGECPLETIDFTELKKEYGKYYGDTWSYMRVKGTTSDDAASGSYQLRLF